MSATEKQINYLNELVGEQLIRITRCVLPQLHSSKLRILSDDVAAKIRSEIETGLTKERASLLIDGVRSWEHGNAKPLLVAYGYTVETLAAMLDLK